MAFALGPKAEAAGYRVASFETIGSTSTEALARAKGGDPGRLWVAAKAQTAGHGRRGRAWETPEGNLAASLLLRLSLAPAQIATLGFVAGLALEAAISEVTNTSSPLWGEAESERNSESGLRRAAAASAEQAGEGTTSTTETEMPSPRSLGSRRLGLSQGGRGGGKRDGSAGGGTPPDTGPPPPHPPGLRRVGLSPEGRGGVRLKWPNDVLVDGAKVAGILLQAVPDSGGQSSVVVGMGVNVVHAPESLPYPATSLKACGVETDAERLFIALSEAWVEQEAVWDGGRGFDAVRRRWLERAAGLGEAVAVGVGADVWRGVFETIDGNGMLVVRAADGSARKVAAGDVHFGAVATAGREQHASGG